MSVRVVCIWLTLLASVMTGGEVVCEPGDKGSQDLIRLDGEAAWDRPSHEAPSGVPPATVEESVLATASESEEEESGFGLVAWEPQVIVPFDPSCLGSARSSTLPLLQAPRLITRLRC